MIMAQGPPTPLPGIVTDQPEIYESEPVLSDDTGVNDLDLLNDPTDDAIALIEVPIKQAFSYFAERENEIAKFYVQRHGEYKISGDKPDEESDIEKYHRLVSEVNQLLDKFKARSLNDADKKHTTLNAGALTTNLEIIAKQLKALEFAGESLDPTQSGFNILKSKLKKLKESENLEESTHLEDRSSDDSNERQLRMSTLERRLNILENIIGNSEDKAQALFRITDSDNLTDVANKLGTWSSLFKSDNLQRVNRELDFVNERLEKVLDRAENVDESKQLDAQSKAKLDHLYNLISDLDKYRAKVAYIMSRLNSMEKLQENAVKSIDTIRVLEEVQAQIVDSLDSNKDQLSSLSETFAKNIDLIKEFSKDIDNRINAIRERDR